jgi:poly(A) polymerase
VIRTIGAAHERFGEDYLRMLRAVRFAVRLDFEIEKKTWEAIRDLAGAIVHISAERIAAELEGILTHPNRRRGAELLSRSGLAKHIFTTMTEDDFAFGADVGGRMGKRIDWPMALAGWFAAMDVKKALAAAETLKLSGAAVKHLRFLLEKRGVLLDGDLPLAELKMLAGGPYFWDLYDFQAAIQKARGESLAGLAKIKKRVMALKGKNLCPRPLLDGHELIALGAVAGPMVGRLSREMYVAQLAEEIGTAAQARTWVESWLKTHITNEQ